MKNYKVKQKELTSNIDFLKVCEASDEVTADLDTLEDFIAFLQKRVNLKSPMRIETISIEEVSDNG